MNRLALYGALVLTGAVIGSGAVLGLQARRQAERNEVFAQRVRCEGLAQAHAKSVSTDSTSAFIERVDFSVPRNTCLAAVDTYREGHSGLTYVSEVLDLLTKEVLFTDFCFGDNCGGGHNSAITAKRDEAFATLLVGANVAGMSR